MLTQIHERDLALRQSDERLRLSLEASHTGHLGLERGARTWTIWDGAVHRLHGVEFGEVRWAQ